MNTQKGFSALPVILIIAAVLLIGGFVIGRDGKGDDSNNAVMEENGEYMMEEKEGDVMMEKSPDADGMESMKDKTMTAENGMGQYAGTVLAGSSAPLIDYNKTDYDTALASDKLVVLYFYANWCPICKKEVANELYPAFNELANEDVVGFRVNYNDNETDSNEKALAKEFGVAYQHTKVFLKNGVRVLKSPESWDKERYAVEINKAL